MADSSFSFLDPSTWPTLAPYYLSQDILRGWSFLTINENNSSAPDTERRIIAQDSYGKQLGKVTDAVADLITQSGKETPAFTELLDLRDRVEAAKTQAQADRLKRLADDLKALKAADPEAFKALVDGV